MALSGTQQFGISWHVLFYFNTNSQNLTLQYFTTSAGLLTDKLLNACISQVGYTSPELVPLIGYIAFQVYY